MGKGRPQPGCCLYKSEGAVVMEIGQSLLNVQFMFSTY